MFVLYLSFSLSFMAGKQASVPNTPIAMLLAGLTNPHAGVMATRPTTAPVAAPTDLTFFEKILSRSIHEIEAAAAAMLVCNQLKDDEINCPNIRDNKMREMRIPWDSKGAFQGNTGR